MNDEIKEIKINKFNKSITFINNGIAFSQFGIADEILDLITNLQQEIERQSKAQVILDDMLADYKRENERLKAQLTDTEWEYQNTRFKYEKQYKKGITEELLEDIETCFFNRENPSMIPIDSLDVCHIFGYIDYLKDYKSRCEKATKCIKNKYYKEEYEKKGTFANKLINILQNGSEDKC